MRRAISSAILSVCCLSGQVVFTTDQDGLATLSYAGQTYWDSSVQIAVNACWKVAGVETCGAVSSSPIVKTFGSTWVNHIYGSGAHQFQIRLDYSAPRADTLGVQVSVTNQDTGTDVLSGVTMTPIRIFFPSPPTNFDSGIPIDVVAAKGTITGLMSASPYSLILFTSTPTDGYEIYSNWSTNIQDVFQIDYNLFYDNGPEQSRIDLSPFASISKQLYLRWGATSGTAATIAPDAYQAVGSTEPLLVDWPDRRPVAQLQYTNGYTCRSATNPRGYMNTLSPCTTLDVSNASAVHSQLLTRATNTLNSMNAHTPKPQGVIMWDIEGQEFNQSLSYVGHPELLAGLSPEMDTNADELFALFTDAGYRVGVTLRPQRLLAQTSTPATCYSSTGSLKTVLIRTDLTYQNRAFHCFPTNTWDGPYATGPEHQFGNLSAADVITQLEAAITYASNRWGTTIYYVDSTNWDSTTWPAFHVFSATIWRQIQSDFPDALFIPEFGTPILLGSTGPFQRMDGGVYNSSATDLLMYPEGFRTLITDNADIPSHSAAVINGVQQGNVGSYLGWFTPTDSTDYDAAFALAQTANSSLQMTDSVTSRGFTFSGTPATIQGTYPVTMRTYFASTTGGLAGSTTYCQQVGGVTCFASGTQQATAALNLTGLTVYQVKYYDFAGGFVAQDGPASLTGTTGGISSKVSISSRTAK